MAVTARHSVSKAPRAFTGNNYLSNHGPLGPLIDVTNLV